MPLLLGSEEHTSELQSPCNLVCRLLLEKKNKEIDSCKEAIDWWLDDAVALSAALARESAPGMPRVSRSMRLWRDRAVFLFFFFIAGAPPKSPPLPPPPPFRT